MAYGIVNVSGGSGKKLEEIKEMAQNAYDNAQAALDVVTAFTSKIGVTPSQNGSLTYNGQVQTPAWNNYDASTMTIGGTQSATDAGTYQVTFTPKEGYEWSDGTEGAKTVSWTIERASISTPSQKGSLTYTGSALTPSWNNYDSAKMTLGGTTSGTNAGTYNATFTPKSNYKFSDGSTTAKTVSWTIGKAAGSLSLNKSSVTLSGGTKTATVTATRAGNGAISASSSNTGIATVSVSGTTITITAKATGTVTITVKCAAGTNHNAPGNKTISVTVKMASATLGDNTPAEIKEAAQSGQAKNLWSVGDKIAIKLSGKVGALTFNGTYYAVIIGFNHNSTVEGNNSIHFQFGKTSAGKDIAFVDSAYGDTGSSAAFRMNTKNSNTGGWKNSYMRTTICTEFLNALPTDWQNVIVACTKYTDNTGDGVGTASCVTSTQDKIWPLAEFEVFGVRKYANESEKNYQKQYDYYKNGNSTVKYKHDSTGSTCIWWLRSVRALDYAFCGVAAGGVVDYYSAYFSRGFAPGFKVS